MMQEILLSRNAIIIYEILIVVVLLILLIVQNKKNKDMKERKKIREEKMRYIRLEEQLKNPDVKSEWSKIPNPFDVQYSSKIDANRKTSSEFQIGIEVRTETSIQKYLFDLDKEITIGKSENNVLPINERLLANTNGSIYVKDHAVYLKHWKNTEPICIQRGKNKKIIDNQMVRLQSKDMLTLGKTIMNISIYEN